MSLLSSVNQYGIRNKGIGLYFTL